MRDLSTFLKLKCLEISFNRLAFLVSDSFLSNCKTTAPLEFSSLSKVTKKLSNRPFWSLIGNLPNQSNGTGSTPSGVSSLLCAAIKMQKTEIKITAKIIRFILQ
jgi:hypothetical protein